MDGRTLSVQRSLPRGSRPSKGGSAASATAATSPPPPMPPSEAAAGGGGEKEAEESSNTAKKSKKKKTKKAEGKVVVAANGIKWPAHPTTVFVRGLGLSATSQDLREAFVGIGPVVEARVVEDKRTRETKVGKGRGVWYESCFVNPGEEEQAGVVVVNRCGLGCRKGKRG